MIDHSIEILIVRVCGPCCGATGRGGGGTILLYGGGPIQLSSDLNCYGGKHVF